MTTKPLSAEEKKRQDYFKTANGVALTLYGKIRVRSNDRGWTVPFSSAEFRVWFLKQPRIKYLMFAWKKNGYKSLWKPSVDRIDCKQPYSFPNMQLVSWRFNRKKGDFENSQRTTEVIQLDRNLNVISIYPSLVEAQKQTGCNQGNISAVCLGKRNHTGGFFWRHGKTKRLLKRVSK